MGKITDKFKKAFNSDVDDDYEDFDDDDLYDDDMIDEDAEEEPEKKRGFFGGGRSSQAEEKESRESSSRFSRNQSSKNSVSRTNGNEVCIFKTSSIEDSREITETLLQGKAVVVNFEGLHVEISQRIIDFISGSCYALDGNLQKISNYIFIATPNSVDISGDFQNLFSNDEGSFDISGFKSPLI